MKGEMLISLGGYNELLGCWVMLLVLSLVLSCDIIQFEMFQFGLLVELEVG